MNANETTQETMNFNNKKGNITIIQNTTQKTKD